MAQTGAERKAAYDQRRREAGAVKFDRWVTPQEREALNAFLAGLRAGGKQ